MTLAERQEYHDITERCIDCRQNNWDDHAHTLSGLEYSLLTEQFALNLVEPAEQVEIAAVKKALQWVLYTNQILLTDVFRYCNVYVQTTKTAGKFLVDSPADSAVAVYCLLTAARTIFNCVFGHFFRLCITTLKRACFAPPPLVFFLFGIFQIDDLDCSCGVVWFCVSRDNFTCIACFVIYEVN